MSALQVPLIIPRIIRAKPFLLAQYLFSKRVSDK